MVEQIAQEQSKSYLGGKRRLETFWGILMAFLFPMITGFMTSKN